jgi:glycosyltransferase involved in cell wall biosynthesis
MRVALVHDWLTGMRGGEAILEALCRLLPGAPIFTLVHVPGSVSPLIESRPIHASFVQRLPFGRTRYRHYLPLFPLAIERFDLAGFDLVVSVSHCVAKGVIPAPRARHVSISLTPVRYAWDRYQDYFAPGRAGRLARLLAGPVCHWLRAWDVASAPRVDRFVAISRFVEARIARYYGRSSEVLYPPVAAARFAVDPAGPEDYYLVVAALVPYKRVDDAIEACGALGRRLRVVGDGPDRKRLERLARRAGAKVEFLGRVPDADLPRLYARARAFLFPGVEDFGIAPLESLAAGRPVVALAEGGAVETIGASSHGAAHQRGIEGSPAHQRGIDGRLSPFGVLYDGAGPGPLAQAILDLEKHPDGHDPARLRARALEFDRPVFEARLAALLASEGVEPAAAPAGARSAPGAGPC